MVSKPLSEPPGGVFAPRHQLLTLSLVEGLDPNGTIFRFAVAAKWNTEQDKSSGAAGSVITWVLKLGLLFC